MLENYAKLLIGVNEYVNWLKYQITRYDALLTEYRKARDNCALCSHKWEYYNDSLGVVAVSKAELEMALTVLLAKLEDTED